MLSRKYYKMIAKCIKESSFSTRRLLHKDRLIEYLSDELKADNGMFNRETFNNACDK